METKPKTQSWYSVVLSTLITPLLLYFHYTTQHNGFLFIFSAILVLVTAFLIGANIVLLSVIGSDGIDTKYREAIRKNMDPAAWKRVLQLIIAFGALTYLIWAECYVTATLLIIEIIVVRATLWFWKQYANAN